MVLRFRGTPFRDINGLPYSVHQIGDEQWQVVIQNCTRHPAGYSFAPVYGSYDEAMDALDQWPTYDSVNKHELSGDDTGAAFLARFED